MFHLHSLLLFIIYIQGYYWKVCDYSCHFVDSYCCFWYSVPIDSTSNHLIIHYIEIGWFLHISHWFEKYTFPCYHKCACFSSSSVSIILIPLFISDSLVDIIFFSVFSHYIFFSFKHETWPSYIYLSWVMIIFFQDLIPFHALLNPVISAEKSVLYMTKPLFLANFRFCYCWLHLTILVLEVLSQSLL